MVFEKDQFAQYGHRENHLTLEMMQATDSLASSQVTTTQSVNEARTNRRKANFRATFLSR